MLCKFTYVIDCAYPNYSIPYSIKYSSIIANKPNPFLSTLR